MRNNHALFTHQRFIHLIWRVKVNAFIHLFQKRLREMRRKMKQKKNQLQEIQDAIYAVDIQENDMTINDIKAEMK